MCAPTIQALSVEQLADLHTRFLVLLPRIERHGRIYFRHLRGHPKEEVFQEMRSLAWLWFVRLARGRLFRLSNDWRKEIPTAVLLSKAVRLLRE
jgi:hypothetical protein